MGLGLPLSQPLRAAVRTRADARQPPTALSAFGWLRNEGLVRHERGLTSFPNTFSVAEALDLGQKIVS